MTLADAVMVQSLPVGRATTTSSTASGSVTQPEPASAGSAIVFEPASVFQCVPVHSVPTFNASHFDGECVSHGGTAQVELRLAMPD